MQFMQEIFAKEIETLGWSIGEASYGLPSVQRYGNDGRLEVGSYCSVGGSVVIMLGGEHRPDWVTTYPFSFFWPGARHIEGHPGTRGDVVIGHDVWIGQGALILSGVRIGDGACIGAGAVVSRDVEPYTIAAGNPARTIRKRFEDHQIAALARIQWWRWPKEVIEEHVGLLLSSDIDEFIRVAREVTSGLAAARGS